MVHVDPLSHYWWPLLSLITHDPCRSPVTPLMAPIDSLSPSSWSWNLLTPPPVTPIFLLVITPRPKNPSLPRHMRLLCTPLTYLPVPGWIISRSSQNSHASGFPLFLPDVKLYKIIVPPSLQTLCCWKNNVNILYLRQWYTMTVITTFINCIHILTKIWIRYIYWSLRWNPFTSSPLFPTKK